MGEPVMVGGIIIQRFVPGKPRKEDQPRAIERTPTGGPLRREPAAPLKPPAAAPYGPRPATALPPSKKVRPPDRSSTGVALASLVARGWADPVRDRIFGAMDRGGSATDLGQMVQRLRAEHATSGVYATAWRDYESVCRARGEATLPLTAAKVLAMAVDYVARRGNQAKGVSALVTRLKAYALTTGVWSMSADDEERMRGDSRFLVGHFPYAVKPAAAITYEELDQALAWLARQPPTDWTRMMRAVMTVMHGGLLRGSETTDGHLLVRDAKRVHASDREGRGGYRLELAWRKKRKLAFDPRDAYTMIVKRDNEARCPVQALDDYLAKARLRPEEPLFVERARSGKATGGGLSYDSLTRQIREVFQAAGVVNAYQFTGRGFRAGGHTDLYREVRDFNLIGLLGGWKDPKSQLLYLRLNCLSFAHLSELIV